MRQHGWTTRTQPGIPGLPGSSWWDEGVSFVDSEPGNRLLRIAAETAGTPETTQLIQLCHERKYLRGTYAARVYFRDAPVSDPDGDAIVETFYSITPPSEERFSEIDFEYLPNGGWGVPEKTLWVTSWASWGVVRPRPEDAEHDQDNTSSRIHGSFSGWHVLLAQVTEDEVRYFVDDHWKPPSGVSSKASRLRRDATAGISSARASVWYRDP